MSNPVEEVSSLGATRTEPDSLLDEEEDRDCNDGSRRVGLAGVAMGINLVMSHPHRSSTWHGTVLSNLKDSLKVFVFATTVGLLVMTIFLCKSNGDCNRGTIASSLVDRTSINCRRWFLTRLLAADKLGPTLGIS